ncbi:hypothetical protein LX64_01183 [Chitinophaga skermanii]|uniref:SnoaL-like domain-containing protein n=1 Tax=Chitinophaga skermanii TaxID=331697 RepID=A0A327QVV7_9BACT|nr:nuclear transport factor 2 family protein [Chitinophaga skermanii]RAJ08530.1 hypothetical protein LX64_01183 [Chitinophaga skermanii]
MEHPNLAIIHKFYEAYGKHDMNEIAKVFTSDAQWFFPGNHPFAGIHKGVEGIVKFFDAMSLLNMEGEPLVMGINDKYLVEAQHTWRTESGITDFDGFWCVVWAFEDGKIKWGRHFSPDERYVDSFFNKITP